MKLLVISLILLSISQTNAQDAVQSETAVHPAVAAAQDFLSKSLRIVDMSATPAQKSVQMCHLVKERFGLITISTELLGTFRFIKKDRVGVKNFNTLLPSIIVSKVLPQLDRAAGAAFDINQTVVDHGNNTVEVTATVGGYNVGLMFYHKGTSWKLIDGEAFGISAIQYTKKAVQDMLTAEYAQNPSRPVTALINALVSEPGFVRCH